MDPHSWLNRRTITAAVAALLTLLSALGVVQLVDDNGDGRADRVVIPVPGSAPVQVDANQQQEPAEQREAATGDTPDVHEDARDETPAGVTAQDVETITEGHTAGLGEPRPTGGAENLSCRQNLVRNRSSRGGARTKIVVLHYTVSKPGTLDVIWRLFNTPSFAASSHIGLEGSGRCEQWVPYSWKAWTQGSFNPVSESVEIIAMGTESRAWWLAQPIFTKGLLASWVRDRLRANGLPLRRVNPSGCAVQFAGWTDHNALECGNTHHDVMPNFPYDVLQKQIVAGACEGRCARQRQLRRWHRSAHRDLRAATTVAQRRAAQVRNRRVHDHAKREGFTLPKLP